MGRKALITGAGSGIGRGLALALARRGYRLALAGRDEQRLRDTAAAAAPFASAGVYPADLSTRAGCDQLAERVLAEFGAPELAVFNAAQMPAGSLLERSEQEIESALGLNLLAPALLARRLGRAEPPPRGMIFVLSTAARFPQPYNSLYSASKSGLRALAEALQVELAGQTRVCLVYPPLTATPMTAARARARRWPTRLHDPYRVGERIAALYEAGRDEIAWLDWEILPSWLYRLAPRLMRWLLLRSRSALHQLFDMD